MLPKQSGVRPQLDERTWKILESQGFTRGLAEALFLNKLAFPLSIWIVDNSGSMNTRDGHRLVETKRQNEVKLVDCTRWAEMQQTVDYHAQLASLLKNPTVFRLLNDPGVVCGPQQFSIGERGEDLIPQDLEIATKCINSSSPVGVTPLTHHINEIVDNVRSMEDRLRGDGTKVVLVIATDGLPSDDQGYSNSSTRQQFVNALSRLNGLPVWIVVRLCTDEESVVDFWNDLDGQLEVSLEVLDDFSGEAQEIYEHNKWLTYGLPLHRMREMGFHNRLFDLLDERKLAKDELLSFFRILFGNTVMDGVPDPQGDWKGFYERISSIVKKEKKTWNAVSRRMEPWVDLSKLKREYGKSGLFGLF